MAAKAKPILCFDLDGTLLYSDEAHARAYNKAFEKNNLPIKPHREITSKFGPPAEVIIKQIFPKISRRKLPKTVKDKNEFLIKETAKFAKVIPGAPEALLELKKKYRLALISNCTHDEILVLLKAIGIKPRLFDAILGKGEMDHKPSPKIIKNVERALGGNVEYMIGDTTFDIKTGKAANIKTIAVLTGTHDIKKLGAEKPTIIIQSVALLPDILFGRL